MRQLALSLVFALLALAGAAPPAAAEDPAEAGGSPPAPAEAAEASEAPHADPAEANAAPHADPAEAGEAPEADAEETPQEVEGFAGVVQKVMTQGLLVRRAGRPTDPAAPAFMLFNGKLGVPVEGQGKDNWMALRRGDVVMVSYVKGPPHRAVKVNVLPKAGPSTVGVPQSGRHKKPPHRSFVGYVKQKMGDQLIVMKPSAPPPVQRPAETKAFARTDHTTVEVLRESWDEIRKGDRVKLAFQKGNPRPLDKIQVIRRGGEEPLPPGVATRLYDPRFDESVKDVDGIGETGPVPLPPRPGQSPQRIQIKRKRPID